MLEVCDGVDNNCNGLFDEGYFDTDDDGLFNCLDDDDDDDGESDDMDCALFDVVVLLLVDEVCDGVDNNCDIFIDEGFVDTDGDKIFDCIDDDIDDDGDFNEIDC